MWKQHHWIFLVIFSWYRFEETRTSKVSKKLRKLSAQRYFQYLMFVFHTKLDIVSLCFCSLESCVLNANKKLLMFFLYFRKKIWTKFNFHWHIISNFWRFVGTIFLFVFQLVTMNLKQKNTKILDRFYNNMNYEQHHVKRYQNWIPL